MTRCAEPWDLAQRGADVGLVLFDQCLPLGVGAALFAIQPDAMAPLIHSWQGWVTCGVVAILEVVGLLFIRRIMAIDI